jgi:plastocyanin
MPGSMRTSPSPRALLAVLVTAALAAVAAVPGCGGDGDVVVDRDGTLRQTLDEYSIEPEKIEVRSGRVHIVARNRGVLTHNVAVQEYHESDEASPKVFARTRTSHPGQTVSTDPDPVLEPGKYRLACTIANHENLGQFGVLYVR